MIFPDFADPGFVALVFIADLAEPQASVDIAVAFDFLVPVFVVAFEVDSSGRPRFLAFPNIDYYASCSSSVEVARRGSGHSPTDVRTNYGPSSILSNLVLSLRNYFNNYQLRLKS